MPDEGPQDPLEPDALARPAAPLPLAERLREAIEVRGWTVGRVGCGRGRCGRRWSRRLVGHPAPGPAGRGRPAGGVDDRGEPWWRCADSCVGAEHELDRTHRADRPRGRRGRASRRVPAAAGRPGGRRHRRGRWPSPDADGDRVNLAAPVADGERVYVLRRGEASVPSAPAGAAPTTGPPGSGSGGAGEVPAELVDLNTADRRAARHAAGRRPGHRRGDPRAPRPSTGRSRRSTSSLDVRGIGDAKLAELRDLVTV